MRRDRTSGPAGREQRAFAGRSCGPPGPDGPVPARGKPAADRMGLRRRGAALRPGAAAGCRSLRDRTRRKALRDEQLQWTAAARRWLRHRRPATHLPFSGKTQTNLHLSSAHAYFGFALDTPSRQNRKQVCILLSTFRIFVAGTIRTIAASRPWSAPAGQPFRRPCAPFRPSTR